MAPPLPTSPSLSLQARFRKGGAPQFESEEWRLVLGARRPIRRDSPGGAAATLGTGRSKPYEDVDQSDVFEYDRDGDTRCILLLISPLFIFRAAPPS